jgi:hypothetical protein
LAAEDFWYSAYGFVSQSGAVEPTQRMLWQREQNILSNARRQVNRIVLDRHLILAFKRQDDRPLLQGELLLESAQTPGTLAIERHLETAVDQNGAADQLDPQVVPQRVPKVDQIIGVFQLQLRRGQFAAEVQAVLLELVQWAKQWHGSDPGGFSTIGEPTS